MRDSPTVKLVRAQIERAILLLRVASQTESLPDMYDAMGLAEEWAGEADRLLCTLPDAELGIENGVKAARKTYEELAATGTIRPRKLTPEIVHDALMKTGGNVSTAARGLGISRRSLYVRMEDFGFKAKRQPKQKAMAANGF